MKKATLGILVSSIGVLAAGLAHAAPPRVPSGRPVVMKMVHVNVSPPVSMAKRFAHLAPAVKVIHVPLNLVKLKEKATGGKRCGIVEVSPGNFIRMDCNNYTKPKKISPHFSAAKTKAVKLHQFAISRASTFLLRAKPGSPNQPKPGVQASASPGTGEQVSEDLPDAVDHRELGVSGPIKSQGMVGACTAFALSSTVDNQLRRANREETTSPSHVWAGYGQPNMEDAADYNLGRGLATLDIWPYNEKEGCELARGPDECAEYVKGATTNSYRSDKTLMASMSKADSSGKIKISAVEEIDRTNLDDILATLSSGNDIWVAMHIDGSKWTDGAMKHAVIPDWSSINGGHAVALAGYRQASGGRQYLIHNSWGADWGDKGYAWISEKMVKQNLMQAYRVKLEGDQNAPVELTDDDCAWDQLVDGVTGKCAKICPDDSRMQNGKCS